MLYIIRFVLVTSVTRYIKIKRIIGTDLGNHIKGLKKRDRVMYQNKGRKTIRKMYTTFTLN